MKESEPIQKADSQVSPPQEPTRRKLAIDELIEWLNNETGFGSMDVSSMDIIEKAQSLRVMEEENIIHTSFEFYYNMSEKMKVDFNKISENRDNAKEFFTQTYNP